MKKYIPFSLTLLLQFVIFFGCSAPKETTFNDVKEGFFSDVKARDLAIPLPYGSAVSDLNIDSAQGRIDIHFNNKFSENYFRKDIVDSIYSSVKSYFGKFAEDMTLTIYTLGKPIEELIPNYYRNTQDYEKERLSKEDRSEREPVIVNLDKPYTPENGLYKHNIVLWHSHGWYYSLLSERWEWQRPRMFQTVEDLLPMSVTIPYLIPMLENSGALVFVPRERDVQDQEVVIDYDTENNIEDGSYSEYSDKGAWQTGGSGFAYGSPPYPVFFNPFLQGTYRVINAAEEPEAGVFYKPAIPETGEYAVYISYHQSPDNITDAHYTVYHAGGATGFKIDQTLGGGTWMYLGTFKFLQDTSLKQGVELTNQSDDPGKLVTADAVRFGGGMGLVAVNGEVSGRPKFVEAGKYWLQYAGMPDTLVYSLNDEENEYNDDYQSRGEYLNYLQGAPAGPNRNRMAPGLGIPIDLSLAFHTDAGVTYNDKVIGTLGIYSHLGADSLEYFPNGVSRFASRDLTDLIQTQIVEDLRTKYDKDWRRRGLRSADYSEAFRPNTPACLLEMLSHQNYMDMKFLSDPRFKFDAARAIYKAMLRFLSVQYSFEYVVQPLPVDHFSLVFEGDGVRLNWKPVEDPMEPTASAEKHVVYTRTDNGGFDNGILVSDTTWLFTEMDPGKIYSFKVTAVNNGGESFPSEILSAGKTITASDPLLIVNGFDRICGPAAIETKEFTGFTNFIDEGVPYIRDINFTGTQKDFNLYSKFRSNPDPGHGASYANMETKIFAGNTFDYPYIHGSALLAAGHSFVSVSDESVTSGNTDLNKYKLVDFIYGEEKETHWQQQEADSINGLRYRVFTGEMINKITKYCANGGNVFISGAYIGKDPYAVSSKDSAGLKFVNNVLKYRWLVGHAAVTSDMRPVNGAFLHEGTGIDFNMNYSENIYRVEAPDALSPIKGAEVLLRYNENGFSSAVGYKGDYGVVAFGFPFETINGNEKRIATMKAVLNYLGL